MEIRLQKYIAEMGVASRRKAEELIKQGRVLVNGNIVDSMGFKVSENDIVEVDGKVLEASEEKVYIMLNKPTGYVTTSKDQFGRPTVVDLVKNEIKQRLYPVGRLDYDTSGLILLTNDGDFTFKLTHPKHEIEKTYRAEVNGIPTEKNINDFENGLQIEDFITSPAKLKVLEIIEENAILEIKIHEGKNRQVRKMCQTIGFPVLKLERIAIGELSIGQLEEGKWRYLTEKELNELI